MNIDTITLKFQSVIGKMKNDISDAINKYTKLDNTLDKVSNSMNKIASNSNMNNSFEKAKQQIKDMEKELESLNSEYTKHLKIWKNERLLGSNQATYNPTRGTKNFDPNVVEIITQKQINEEKSRIDELQAKINELKSSIEQPTAAKELIPKDLVPKTDEGIRKIKDIGNESKNTGNKFNSTKNKARQMSNSFANIGKSFKGIGSIFKDTGKNISKNMDKGLRSLKKFTLGLIGVRTVMSLLTKSVNAYLSFDSDLQESLNNSWNMLGSLLAPAIELVANLFATATNYIYRFVEALTGIDLVARANAKALESQAKATQKNAAAQRGLLAMDEITNLPTESGGGASAPQITVKDIDTKGMFSDLIEAFKKHDWHRAGEIIAEGINKGLKKIDWDIVRTKAEKMGKNVALFLNGIFELDWKTLGMSIANAVNSGIDFAYGFIHNFEWGRLGVGMGDALSEFFSTFDYNKLADSINEFVLGVYDMIKGFIAHLDTEELSDKIVEFIERIDWGKIIEGLIEVIALWLKVTLKFYWNVFKKIIGDFIDSLKPGMNDAGEKIGKSFGDKMKGAFKKALNVMIDLINLFLYNFRAAIKVGSMIGGKEVKMDQIKIPHLATGTNNIETEGLYHLHEGEAVVPKKYNPATSGYDNSADNRQIIDLLISLNSSMIEYANRPIRLDVSGKKIAEATYDDLQTINRNRNSSNVVTRS
jgi:tetrahydromethanopterin S-methyltransferase subunit G